MCNHAVDRRKASLVKVNTNISAHGAVTAKAPATDPELKRRLDQEAELHTLEAERTSLKAQSGAPNLGVYRSGQIKAALQTVDHKIEVLKAAMYAVA